jgi:hypothetical protein
MSTVEDRVRDAFQADARTVRPETVPALRLPDHPRRVRRPAAAPGRWQSRPVRWLVPLSAAAAVALLAAGASVLSPGAPHRARLAHSPAAAHPAPVALPPGVPRYFIREYSPRANVDEEQVHATATGRVVSTVRPPRGWSLGPIAGTADPQVFLTAIEPSPGPCRTQLYRFRLSGRGQPGRLTSLHITVPGALAGEEPLAVTPDGRTAAYVASNCDGGPERVAVVNLVTRQARVWTRPDIGLGVAMVALSADGKRLSFSYDPGTQDGAPRFAVLDTSSPAGPLMRYSHTVPGSPPDWALLAGGGTSLYACATSGDELSGPASITYSRISADTGQSQVIAQWPDLPQPFCEAALDPAGRYALIAYPAIVPGRGQQATPAILDLTSGALIHIPASPVPAENQLAW